MGSWGLEGEGEDILGPRVAGDEGQARLEHCTVCSLGLDPSWEE